MIGTEKNERRDWTLLIFIIPLGIILIILVGQLAVRLVPSWRVNTDMNSNLEPDASSARPFALLEPILPQILTPMAWVESYLTPGAEISFPPFLTFQPTLTPSPTSPTPIDITDTPTAVVTETVSPTAVTGTTPPTDRPDNGGGTPPPTSTTVSPTVPSPSPTTPSPSPSPTTPSPSPSPSPTATSTGFPATMESGYTLVTPPSQIGSTPGPPDNANGQTNKLGIINQGTYIVINFSVVVENTPDANYDFVLYEFNNGSMIYIDRMIIGISNDPNGQTYFEVFNWGDGAADTNTNVGDVAGSEDDEQQTNLNQFYDPDNPDGTSENQTGILIDVDTAVSSPPPDVYDYIVVISPSGEGSMEVDSIDIIEVPISPTP